MTERKYKRYTPRNIIEVVNMMGNNVLGTIANISMGGFLLTSQSDGIQEGSIFQLRLQEKTEQETQAIITAGAACLWRAEGVSPGTFWYGFQIIDISSENNQLLAEHIKTLAN